MPDRRGRIRAASFKGWPCRTRPAPSGRFGDGATVSDGRSLLGAAAAALGRWRPARADAVRAAVLLAFVPLATALALRAAVAVERVRADRLARVVAPRLAAAAAAAAIGETRRRLAPAFAPPTLTDLAARLAARLPADAHVVALGVDEAGGIAVEIETADAEAAAQALAADPLLGRLRRTGQAPAAGEGLRARFATPA